MGRVAVFPVLFALYPVLFLYALNKQIVDFREILIPELAALSALFLLWGAAWAMLRDVRRAALLAAFWILFAQSFQPVQSILSEKAALLTWLALFGLGTALIWAFAKASPRVLRFLNVAALALVAFPLASLVMSEVACRLHPGAPAAQSPPSRTAANPALGRRAVLPNIYHILLDGYARQDVLRVIYHFDNGPFLDALKSRGFCTAPSARSNHWLTTSSLASMLNMAPILPVQGTRDYYSIGGRRGTLKQLIRENAVTAHLAEKGYRSVAFPNGFSDTELRKVDVFKEVQIQGLEGLSSFRYEALSLTPIPMATSVLNPIPSRTSETRRRRFQNVFAHLSETSDRDSPLFVFAHVLSPHPPFVFHADGSPAYPSRPFSGADGSAYFRAGGTLEGYRQGYVDQLQYVNRQVLQAVDGILRRSTRPTVIIVHSDHGPGSGLDWEHPGRTNFFERMSILLSVRLPEGEDLRLPDDLTLVNLYPILFSTLFQEEFPLSPNTSYCQLKEIPPSSLAP